MASWKWAFVLGAGLVLGLVTCPSVCGDLVPLVSFDIPGITGQIDRIEFADIDGDDIAEVLAGDGKIAVLYSVTRQKVLFTTTIHRPYDIELADINRDLSVDICKNCGGLVTCYFGAFNYLDSATQLFPADGSWTGYGVSEVTVKAEDIDSDGYNELLVSSDSLFNRPDPFFGQVTVGSAYLFRIFPDSLWRYHGAYLSGLHPASTSAVHFASEQIHFDYDEFPGVVFLTDSRSLVTLDSTGMINSLADGTDIGTDSLIGATDYCECLFFGCTVESGLFHKIVAQFEYNPECYPEYPAENPSGASGHKLVAYQGSLDGPADFLWAVNLGSEWLTAFLYTPSYPGEFFAVSGNTLSRYSAEDGSVVRRYDSLPAGAKLWSRPLASPDDVLIVLSGHNVSYYAFDVVTDVQIESSTANLPTSFSLSRPYPNPFNPEVTVPITMREKTHLKAEVFNALGQRVGILYDRVASAGELALVWNGRDFSTGLYFFRATAGGLTRSVKAVLVK